MLRGREQEAEVIGMPKKGKMDKMKKEGKGRARDADISEMVQLEQLKTVPPHRWDDLKSVIDRYWEDPKALPRDGRDRKVLILGEHQLPMIASKERLRIIRLLKDGKDYSLQELTRALHRDPAAVSRDISVLERCGILRKEHVGKTMRPVINADMILLPIVGTNLLDLLYDDKDGKSKDGVALTAQKLEDFIAVSYIYDKIFSRLEKKMQGHRNLTLTLNAWILQELEELQDRLVRRVETVPEECWEDEAAPLKMKKGSPRPS